ncbi:hypothetical protein B0T16DRAFT_82534 [Cercophora newfieldiana]|uniref:Uncharacterized protein n=1 Tax=Cercophora newfieldiana TaxID=92897 RepID=A0AA39YGP6_9PEZI|nr:hypothetical protein B0T16DRAFT_82534 [Cercophora newfieldiana]
MNLGVGRGDLRWHARWETHFPCLPVSLCILSLHLCYLLLGCPIRFVPRIQDELVRVEGDVFSLLAFWGSRAGAWVYLMSGTFRQVKGNML